jgi:hypothetical protein
MFNVYIIIYNYYFYLIFIQNLHYQLHLLMLSMSSQNYLALLITYIIYHYVPQIMLLIEYLPYAYLSYYYYSYSYS